MAGWPGPFRPEQGGHLVQGPELSAGPLVWTVRGVTFQLAGSLACKHFPPPQRDHSGPQQLCGKSLRTRDTRSSGENFLAKCPPESGSSTPHLMRSSLLPGQYLHVGPLCLGEGPCRRWFNHLLPCASFLWALALPMGAPLIHSFSRYL